MKKRTHWWSIGGGIAGVIILAVVAVTLMATHTTPITSVIIVQIRAAEGIPVTFVTPHTANNAAKAQQLYDAVRALQQPTGDGIMSCPIDFGISYQLTFRSDSEVQLTAILQGGGCRTLYIGGNHGYITNAAFWRLLADTFGVSEEQLFPATPR
jgi:hypothetical protein